MPDLHTKHGPHHITSAHVLINVWCHKMKKSIDSLCPHPNQVPLDFGLTQVFYSPRVDSSTERSADFTAGIENGGRSGTKGNVVRG